jgi:hypothetical protein
VSLIDELIRGYRADPRSAVAALQRVSGVPRDAEFLRIAGLPRRSQDVDNALEQLAEQVTLAYKTPLGTAKFRVRQAFVLREFHDYGGAVGALPAGYGKTLISYMAPRVVEAERPLIMVPAPLVKKTVEDELPFWMQHFRVARNLRVESYSKLSHADGENFLFDINPDMIVLDEAQNLRDPNTSRTRRYLRFMRERPHVRVLVLSASITSTSVKDYAHLFQFTHGRERSPLPTHYNTLSIWADALDADVPIERRIAPGALEELCRPGEHVREGFRRRLLETPGVIASTQTAFESGPAPALNITDMPVPSVPPAITEAFRVMRTEFVTPSGEEVVDGKAQWRHANTLSFGYYMRWVWPGGQPDHEWLNKRKDWNSKAREAIVKSGRGGLPSWDSEGVVRRACENASAVVIDVFPELLEAYAAWMGVRDRYGPTGPPTEAVWFTYDMLEIVAQQVQAVSQYGPTIAWVRSPSMGELLARRLGWVYFGAGAEGIEQHRSSCVASVKAHGTGRNLQYFNKAVFIARPYNGADWEQVVCREWRPGQLSPSVDCYVYNHCYEMWLVLERSKEHAQYIEHTIGNPQALLRANFNTRLTATVVNDLIQSGDPLWAKTRLVLPSGSENFEGGSL